MSGGQISCVGFLLTFTDCRCILDLRNPTLLTIDCNPVLYTIIITFKKLAGN